jgi:hypothetical protein
VSDLFGVAGRKLLDRLDIPEPWRGHVDASLMLIDQLDRQGDRGGRAPETPPFVPAGHIAKATGCARRSMSMCSLAASSAGAAVSIRVREPSSLP